jgi:F0F1-type ATP synthase membrane subunit c/vacuolar-type H+-ATPase subunit K
MAATIIGNSTNLAFGIASAQTGMVIQSISSSASSDAVELKNKSGDVTAVAFRNKKTTHTVQGAYTTFSGLVGASVTVANGNAFGLSGAAYITEVSRNRSADNFETVSFTAVRYDGIT